VDNNFYTNAGAQETMRGAAMMTRRLWEAGLAGQLIAATGVTQEELAAFEQAADAMYLPYDEKLGIHAQDDGFLKLATLDLAAIPRENFPLLLHYHPLWLYRHQVCKQADTVLAHFLYEDLADEGIMRRSYDYYERCTTHDSSLSTCVFAIMAARLGDMGKAVDYFRQSATMDLDDAHGNTKDGIHTANMGGTWLAITAGFGGLRVKPDGLHLHPRLPDAWRAYSFPLTWRGSELRVHVSPKGWRIVLAEGEAVDVHVNGQCLRVAAGQCAQGQLEH